MSEERHIQYDAELDLSYLGMIPHPITGEWVYPHKVKLLLLLERVKKRQEQRE